MRGHDHTCKLYAEVYHFKELQKLSVYFPHLLTIFAPELILSEYCIYLRLCIYIYLKILLPPKAKQFNR